MMCSDLGTDLCELTNEEAIISFLKKRFEHENIYVSIMLISINSQTIYGNLDENIIIIFSLRIDIRCESFNIN